MPAAFWKYLILTMLAAASVWFARFLMPEPIAESAPPEKVVEYFLTDFTSTEMDLRGAPKRRLAGAALIHYRGSDTTEVTNPAMTLFDAHAPPWVIRSDSGTVSPHGESVFLSGRVVIRRAAENAERGIEIITKNMLVQPEKDYAETEEYAEIISPPDRISGTGLRAYFKKPIKLSLLAHVRGKHETR